MNYQHPFTPVEYTLKQGIGASFIVDQAVDQALLSDALDALAQQLVVLDGSGTILAVNDAWKRFRHSHPLLGQDGADDDTNAWVGRSYLEVCQADPGVAREDAQRLCVGVKTVLAGSLASFRLVYPHKATPRTRWFAVSVTPLLGQRGAVVSHLEITEQKRYEASIEHQANHDPLTGLANRRLFQLEGEQMLALTMRRAGSLALVYLDLDGFKTVNDRFGHKVGDELLGEVGRRLKVQARESDLLARVGGDEFVVLLNDASEEEGLLMTQRYQKSLTQPFKLSRQTVNIRGSFGIACYPEAGDSVDQLLSRADNAMFMAKAAGGGIERWRMKAAQTTAPRGNTELEQLSLSEKGQTQRVQEVES